MNIRIAGWLSALILSCVVTIGCSAPPNSTSYSSYNDHDALVREYQKIADQAVAVVASKPSDDPAVAAEVRALAEKAVALTHRKLTLARQPTVEQAQRYSAASARLQEALHAVCPNCPDRR